MEEKLMNASDLLPKPVLDFQMLEQHMKRNVKTTGKYRKVVRVVLAAVLVMVLLCGMGWAKISMSYGMWTLYASPDWREAKWAAEKFDIQLPETMDGVPFDEYWVFGHVPQGGSWLRAYLSPLYVPRSVNYTVQETIEITVSENMGIMLPEGSTTSYTYDTEQFLLSFGTTENEIWRYYFQFDENGVWAGCEVPESYEVIEYKGITLQIGDTTSYNNIEGRAVYTRWVHWVDEERKMAFSLNESDYEDSNRVVECAKALIDLNLPK